jgi:asparagine synthase (glutamine-hydrolysing)
MSGYAGIVRPGSGAVDANEDAQLVEKMAKAIAYRGPDSQNIWSHPDVHFCFSFLKTGPAPQSKTQPCSSDGRIWLLGDVRLDGREELFRRFEQRGEKVEQTISDEELLLHVFQIFGEAGVAALDGDFSVVLWDSKKKKLSGFRDLTGGKSFFYCASGGGLSFSNTLDALRAAPGFDGALDENFLGDYLLASWCPDPERTVYKQIRRLPPGHALEFSAEGLKVHRVAQLPIEEMIRYGSEEQYVEHYREILHLAVKDRLANGTNVVFMSGGLDSTTVAAEANRTWTKRIGGGTVCAQTVDYKPLFDDKEGEEARRVADYLRIPFEVLHGGHYEPFSGWDAADFPMPEPRHELYLAFHLEQHRRAAAVARVALSGDGGDDVLVAHAWPYLRHLLRRGNIIGATTAVAGHVWTTGRLPVLGLGIRSRIQNRFGGGREPEKFPEWLNPDFEKRLKLRERFEELQKKAESGHPTHPGPYAMLTGPFWPNLLEGEDAAWSGAALETRAPLLDRRMVRYLLRLPAMPWCMDKQLVRRAMKGELPKETLERKKSPLAQDPLELQISGKSWSPLPLREKTWIKEMVDIKRLETCLKLNNGEALYDNLRPVSLGRWLKSVEMKRGIQ